MNNVPKTQEALLLMFIQSFDDVIDAIEKKEKALKKAKDSDPLTVLHYSRGIIQDWFRSKGGLPIPD
jgi:hypothetical protein